MALLIERAGLRPDHDGADLDDVAERRDAEGFEQVFSPGRRRRLGRRFLGAGPLQNAADRAEMFDRAGQVAVSRPGAGEIVQLLDFRVVIGDQHCDGASDGRALPQAAEDFGAIGFEPLPPAAAEASLAAAQFGVDPVFADFDSGGKAFDEGQQCFAVRFAGRCDSVA